MRDIADCDHQTISVLKYEALERYLYNFISFQLVLVVWGDSQPIYIEVLFPRVVSKDLWECKEDLRVLLALFPLYRSDRVSE